MRVARAVQKDALRQTYCQSRQAYYDQRAASPVEDRLHVRARHRQRAEGGIASRTMLVDTEVATTEREVVIDYAVSDRGPDA